MKFNIKHDSDYEQLEAKVAIADPKFARLIAAFYEELARMGSDYEARLRALTRQATLLKRALIVLTSVAALLLWWEMI